MLGFTAVLQQTIPIQIPSIPRPINRTFPSSLLKFQTQGNPRNLRNFVIYADNGNGLSTDPKEKEKEKEKEKDGYSNNGGEDLKKDQLPKFNLRWVDLLLDPDPDNILAVGLTGLLTWASVQVLWQLFIISVAILVAALKYSFIAALLLFILITLL